MRILFVYILLLSTLISCKEQEVSSFKKSSLYPDQLEFGEYGVGLKTLWLYDISRNAIPYSDWNGRLYPTEESKGRQFQVNLWYPTAPNSKGNNITLEHYLDLSYRQINFDVSQEDLEFGRSELRNKLVDLGGLDSLSRENYDRLAVMTVLAKENAAPIEGKVPLILFPNGMSPISNSTTAEFLASHGYAVAGFTTKGKDAFTIDVSAGGIDAAVDDIAFVLGKVLQLPFVDGENIGLLGNAIESSFCAAYLSKNKKIKAFVSLEGGYISSFEQSLLEELPYYQPEYMTVPMLLIYSPHPSIDPQYIEKLKFADRYFSYLPGMREFDYLNFGLWDSLVPGIIGKNRGDVRQGFSSAHSLILAYFNANFHGDLTSFEASILQLDDPAVDTSFIWRSKPVTPPMFEIKDGFIRRGLPFLDSIYNRQKEFVEVPFSKAFINDFIDWVSWKKDPQYKTRKWLMEKMVEDYPNSALYSYYLARYALRSGDTVMAKEQFREVLRKLPDDPDETLTADQKEKIRSNTLSQQNNLN